jgi:hypothetical protein
MPKPPRGGLEPLKIFVHASHFHESDHRLRNTVPLDQPKQLVLIAHPSLVLSVFASELYLKCLLCVETGLVPETHNLKLLFGKLLPLTQHRLEELWDADVRRPERAKLFDFIRTLPEGKSLRLDLRHLLDIGANAFIEFRYVYEGKRSYFLLSDFPDLLRKVIIERFPAWEAKSAPESTTLSR